MKGDILMKRNFLLLMAIISLAFASLACSVFGGDDAGNGKELESPQATQSDNDRPPEATQPNSDQPPGATEASEFEEASIDASSIWVFRDIQSYRGDFTWSFDGTSGSDPANGSITMTVEFTSAPPAQHTIINLDGYDLDLEYGDLSSIEFYTMEDTTYLNFGMGDGWISIPNDLDDSFSEGIISYEDFVDLPERSRRKLLPENVNGVTAWHYVLDEGDFLEGFTTYDEVSGDVWIAVDGGYIVKIDISMTGTFAPDIIHHQPIDQGTMKISFNLRGVNENFTIKLPQEADSANDSPLPDEPGGDGGWARQDVPLPDDAEINNASEDNVTAQTQLSFEETVEFFQTQLQANGWVAEWENYGVTEIYNGGFVKGAESLTLNLIPSRIAVNRISITITIDR
jgi:hypothetical protein